MKNTGRTEHARCHVFSVFRKKIENWPITVYVSRFERQGGGGRGGYLLSLQFIWFGLREIPPHDRSFWYV